MGCKHSTSASNASVHAQSTLHDNFVVVSPVVVASRRLPRLDDDVQPRQLRPAPAARSPKSLWQQLASHFPTSSPKMDAYTAQLAHSALMLRCPHPVLAEVCEFLCGRGDVAWRSAQPLPLRAVCKDWRNRIDQHCISHLSIKYERVSPVLGLTKSQRDRLHARGRPSDSILTRVRSVRSAVIEPVEPSLVYSNASPFLSFLSNLRLATHLTFVPSQHALDEGGFVRALEQVNALQHCNTVHAVSASKLAMGDKAVGSLLRQLAQPPGATPIRCLDLSSNNLNRAGSGVLEAMTAPRFRDLRELNMRGNWIGASGARELSRVSASMPRLRHLNLQSCCLDRPGARALASAMQAWPLLEHLDVCNNFFGFGAVQELAAAIGAATRLRCLVLSRNALGNASVFALGKTMVHSAALEELHLERCSLDDGCADTLSALLQRLPGLRQLSLGDNALSHRAVQGMSRALLGMRDMQDVSVRHCGVMDEGFRELCASLRGAAGLHSLDVGSNSISGAGIQHIHMLHAECKLRSFNNRMNPIGSAGMASLGSWLLSHGAELEYLQLSWNSLDADGCASLRQALAHLPKLQELVLVGNVIGDEACTGLLDTLGRSHCARTLQVLDLSWNNLTDESESPLKRAIKRLPLLHTLRIASNFMSPSTQRRLLKAGSERSPPLLHMTKPT